MRHNNRKLWIAEKSEQNLRGLMASQTGSFAHGKRLGQAYNTFSRYIRISK